MALAASDLNEKLAIKHLSIFGFYFENLVYRDLKIYAQYLDAKLFYYRDSNGNEVDFILEFEDKSYFAIEVKLGDKEKIDEAANNLIAFKDRCQVQKDKNKKERYRFREWVPKALIVITGLGSVAYQREDGVYVVPIGMLKP
ncbi:DUF4143 domain-containing protein [Mycoplasma sp. NEAQ87857]|nr:DUF4143 domain-containing protein [Mycoplasma sp. NEAQ87857]